LWSQLYEGSRPSVNCLKPAVLALEGSLELGSIEKVGQSSLDLGHRKRIEWRLDGGFGSDNNLQYLLQRSYQFTAKGYSGKRANALAKQVKRWTPFGDVWLGRVASPIQTQRPLFAWVKRRILKDKFRYSYYLSTRKYPALAQAMRAYNQRGGAEIEQFRNDKQGLHLSARRKRNLIAQKALILITDLAHNLIAHFYNSVLVHSGFTAFGLKRIVRDLFAIEGRLVIKNGQLAQVELADAHAQAKALYPLLIDYLLNF